MVQTGIERRTNWWPAVVIVLALTWISLALYFFGHWFSLGWDAWALGYDGTPKGEQARTALGVAEAAAFDHMLIVIVLGTLVTAVVAAVGRMRATAIVFAVITVPVLLLGGVELAHPAHHDTPPPARPYGQCVARSGSEIRCPGG